MFKKSLEEYTRESWAAQEEEYRREAMSFAKADTKHRTGRTERMLQDVARHAAEGFRCLVFIRGTAQLFQFFEKHPDFSGKEEIGGGDYRYLCDITHCKSGGTVTPLSSIESFMRMGGEHSTVESMIEYDESFCMEHIPRRLQTLYFFDHEVVRSEHRCFCDMIPFFTKYDA